MVQATLRSKVVVGRAVGAFAVGLVAFSVSDAFAEDVSVGGSHERLLVDAQRSLAEGAGERSGLGLGNVRITVGNGEASALTGFTPRFGALGRDPSASSGDIGRLLKTRDQASPSSQQVTIAPETAADFAGLGVMWSARAALQPGSPGEGVNPSSLSLGGELAFSGLQLDASYSGSEDRLVGPDGSGLSAGVGYDFGTVATRMGYSLVERDSPDETSLFTVGSQLAINPGLVVSGDVAYAKETEGTSSTAGVVSFKFSF